MKPTIRSTAIAFALLGAIAFFLLPFLGTIVMVPSVLAAVGLYLRLRYAWWLGLACALVDLGVVAVIIGLALLVGRGGWSWTAMTLPVAQAGYDVYLLVSLAVIRSQFKKA